jgi:hypothetical protein
VSESPVCLLYAPGFGLLAMTPEELQQAVSRGREATRGIDAAALGFAPDGTAPAKPEGLLDAEGMADATGVPASWFESAANRGDIPSIKFGRWRRFDLQQVLQSGALHGKERVIGQAQVRKVDELPVARRLRTRN